MTCWRNTPTHVGKTAHSPPRHQDGEKHPHARGEDGFLLDGLALPEETPPRTWGRPDRHWLQWENFGNTPTHVGKTEAARLQSFPDKKHPHARGEDSSFFDFFLLLSETPPRTWGRLFAKLFRQTLCGNTPTHVGKTAGRRPAWTTGRKHPHARGEDPPLESLFITSKRNTPTHVGKTQKRQGEKP